MTTVVLAGFRLLQVEGQTDAEGVEQFLRSMLTLLDGVPVQLEAATELPVQRVVRPMLLVRRLVLNQRALAARRRKGAIHPIIRSPRRRGREGLRGHRGQALGGLGVNDQLELRRLHDWQFRRLGTFKDTAAINTSSGSLSVDSRPSGIQ